MILFAVEAPEDERDIDRRKSAYVTGKEFRWWLLIVVALLSVGYVAFFLPWKKNRDFVVGKNNLQDISQAIGLYAANNNDGIPATYLSNMRDAEGYPETWANALVDSTKHIDSFRNPSNPWEGDTLLSRRIPDGTRIVFPLSYGMLSSASALRKYEIRDETIIVAETIGSGVLGSFNPMPLGGRDGFLIGYDNSNMLPNASTKSVTRLAFTQGGSSSVNGSLGIAALRADGSVVVFQDAKVAKVNKRGNVPTGQWVPN